MFNVAAIQMVSTDNVEENLDVASTLIDEAASNKARLITLPENFPLMGKTDEARLAIVEQPGSGRLQGFLSTQAKKHGVWLLGGTIPIDSGKPAKVFAASLLYNMEGRCIASYNKMHLFDALVNEASDEAYRESDTFEAGDSPVTVETDIGNIGLSVCYDLRFPEFYRGMHSKNVQIITVPSAFTATTGEAHWESLLRARAIENLCYVIASNQGGRHANGRDTWGHSMIIDPWGRILASHDSGAGIALASIDLNEQEKLRQIFPALSHRKLDYKLNE